MHTIDKLRQNLFFRQSFKSTHTSIIIIRCIYSVFEFGEVNLMRNANACIKHLNILIENCWFVQVKLHSLSFSIKWQFLKKILWLNWFDRCPLLGFFFSFSKLIRASSFTVLYFHFIPMKLSKFSYCVFQMMSLCLQFVSDFILFKLLHFIWIYSRSDWSFFDLRWMHSNFKPLEITVYWIKQHIWLAFIK